MLYITLSSFEIPSDICFSTKSWLIWSSTMERLYSLLQSFTLSVFAIGRKPFFLIYCILITFIKAGTSNNRITHKFHTSSLDLRYRHLKLLGKIPFSISTISLIPFNTIGHVNGLCVDSYRNTQLSKVWSWLLRSLHFSRECHEYSIMIKTVL